MENNSFCTNANYKLPTQDQPPVLMVQLKRLHTVTNFILAKTITRPYIKIQWPRNTSQTHHLVLHSCQTETENTGKRLGEPI